MKKSNALVAVGLLAVFVTIPTGRSYATPTLPAIMNSVKSCARICAISNA